VYLLQKALRKQLFAFHYHYYGPYSAEVAAATDRAIEAGLVKPEERSGYYNINYVLYTSLGVGNDGQFKPDALRQNLGRLDQHDALVLEVAATWYFLEFEERNDRSSALKKVKQLKPGKASDARIAQADQLLKELGLH
jgi:uncharacterized protein YwgA